MVKLSELFFPKKNVKEFKEPQIKEIVLHTEAIGTTGIENYSGYYYEDYLNKMRGKDRADTFDRMYRSDYQSKGLIGAVTGPIKEAKWSIEPYRTDDPEFEKDAELVRYCLMEGMDKPFSQFISEALSVVKHGHALFEMIDRVTFHPEFGAINGLKTMKFISQRTIERWNFDPETEDMLNVSQYAFGDTGKVVDIPADFLVVFTLDKEGINYEGISMLRPCYGNWKRKDTITKLNIIGIEKFAVPTAVGTIPEGKQNTADYGKFENALKAWTSHQKGYIIKPEGWSVDFNNNVYDPQKVETSIDNEDKRMAKAFIANFLELGINGFGSQSLSVDLSDFFLNGITHIAKAVIAEEITRCVIPRLVKMNRGPRPGYPKLKVSGINDKAGLEFARVLNLLVPSKVITPDDKLEKHARTLYDMPEMSEEGRRDVTPAQNQNDVEEDEDKQDELSNPKMAEAVRKLIRG